jgi:hypothetical protein
MFSTPPPLAGGGRGRGAADSAQRNSVLFSLRNRCTKNLGFDHLNHALKTVSHIVVGETNDAETLALDPARALLVPGDRVIVGFAVDLDDQSIGQADEVDDIGTQSELPTKPAARASFRLELLPQTSLGDRLVAAKKGSSEIGHRTAGLLTPPPTPSRKGRGRE